MDTPQTIGKYQVVGRIGSGAMGEVYKAHDPVLRRDVALKTMSAEFGSDPELRRRFEREAQSAARLTHPHIVTVYELGEEAGHTFIVMELLEGQDLKVLLGSVRLQALEAKLRVMDQVCDALAFAHAHDVVHRDLKPANIRVLPSGALKVMDFGLAHLGGSEMTRAGMVMGTPHYMSPEQVRGHKVDARSDVFSLGAVFYELLTGHKAFEAATLHGILQKVVDEQPVAVRQMDESVPAALVAVVEQALDKDPARRFAHAGDMRAALHAACVAMGRALPAESWSGSTLGDAPTIHDAGALSTPGTVMARRSVAGATALDLGTAVQPATRIGAPATLRGAGLTHPASVRSRAPLLLGLVVLVGLVVAVAGGIWLSRRQPPAPPGPDVQQERAGVLKEALIDNRVELARVNLQNKDYDGAVREAQQALQLDAANAEARTIVERAQAAQRECDDVARAGQDALRRGDTAQASTSLTRLLSLDPRHPSVGTLSAALNAHFRGQSDEARQAMIGARAAARAQAASSFEGFAQAEQLGQQADKLVSSGEFAVAAQKFTEARDGYERAQHAAELQARKAAEAALRTPPPTLAARPTPVAEARLNPPSLPPIAPPSLAPSAAPSAVASTPALPPGQDAAIRAVVNDYARAISLKDVALFKSVKPNLSDADAKRLQDGFKASKTNQVQAQVDRVEGDGKTATVRITRQDTIDGRAMRPMQQTLKLVLTPAGWKIESFGQ